MESKDELWNLLTDKRYAEMTIEDLREFINKEASHELYNILPGQYAKDKAIALHNFLNYLGE